MWFMYLLLKLKKASYSTVFMIVVLSLGLAFSFLFASGIIRFPIDLSPIMALLVFTYFYFGTFRYGLFNTLSLGVIKGLSILENAVLVIDKGGQTIYTNKSMAYFEPKVLEKITAVCQSLSEKPNPSIAEIVEERLELPDQKVFSLQFRRLLSVFGNTVGYVCIINDDTAISKMIGELKEKKQRVEEMHESIVAYAEGIKQLRILEERNALAKEVHDILGHSLNYAVQVLESNKIIAENDPALIRGRLIQAVADIEKGLSEIGEDHKSNSLSSYSAFCQQIKIMGQKQKNIGVDIEIILDALNIGDVRTLKTLYRICQESITNSIKHGQAKKIIISLRKKGNLATLAIVDDGLGCKAVVKGSGLSGMEERLQQVGGKIYFGGFGEEPGFQIHATIPLS